MTSISVLWSRAIMLCCGFWSQINLWMRLDSLNHRGWRVFLVHLSLMTGQRSGWRGNKMGKFSTLLGALWLTEAVIYPRRNNYSLLSLNVTVQYGVIPAAPPPKTVGDISLFLSANRWSGSEWHHYRISLCSFIMSLEGGRIQVFILSAFPRYRFILARRQTDRINVSAQMLLRDNAGWAGLVFPELWSPGF